MVYELALGIRVPDWEVNHTLWIDDHFESGYLFRNAIKLELAPPTADRPEWKMEYGWQNQGFSQATRKTVQKQNQDGKVEVDIPFKSNTTPGVTGKLRFVISGWNLNL